MLRYILYISGLDLIPECDKDPNINIAISHLTYVLSMLMKQSSWWDIISSY